MSKNDKLTLMATMEVVVGAVEFAYALFADDGEAALHMATAAYFTGLAAVSLILTRARSQP